MRELAGNAIGDLSDCCLSDLRHTNGVSRSSHTRFDSIRYESGKHINNAVMNGVNIHPHRTHSQWNCIIVPST